MPDNFMYENLEGLLEFYVLRGTLFKELPCLSIDQLFSCQSLIIENSEIFLTQYYMQRTVCEMSICPLHIVVFRSASIVQILCDRYIVASVL